MLSSLDLFNWLNKSYFENACHRLSLELTSDRQGERVVNQNYSP